jgi:hypothetical protein
VLSRSAAAGVRQWSESPHAGHGGRPQLGLERIVELPCRGSGQLRHVAEHVRKRLLVCGVNPGEAWRTAGGRRSARRRLRLSGCLAPPSLFAASFASRSCRRASVSRTCARESGWQRRKTGCGPDGSGHAQRRSARTSESRSGSTTTDATIDPAGVVAVRCVCSAISLVARSVATRKRARFSSSQNAGAIGRAARAPQGTKLPSRAWLVPSLLLRRSSSRPARRTETSSTGAKQSTISTATRLSRAAPVGQLGSRAGACACPARARTQGSPWAPQPVSQLANERAEQTALAAVVPLQAPMPGSSPHRSELIRQAATEGHQVGIAHRESELHSSRAEAHRRQ